jgi:hypothetical protein
LGFAIVCLMICLRNSIPSLKRNLTAAHRRKVLKPTTVV